MTSFNSIDLSALPAPTVVDDLSYDVILAALVADYQTRYPEYAGLIVEGDPIIKLLEVAAYREVVLRQRINDAAKAVMLAYATGSDLDHLAALIGVARRIVTAADPTAVPPVAEVVETDETLRARVQLAPAGYSVAGPAGAYIYHALSASGAVVDAAAASPSPGDVTVTVLLAGQLDGQPADFNVLDAVEAVLSGDDCRPLTDRVTVVAATIVPTDIVATLTIYSGPDPAVVRSTALSALTTWIAARARIGDIVAVSGILAALHVAGVQSVHLTSPEVDVDPGDSGVVRIASIQVDTAGAA